MRILLNLSLIVPFLLFFQSCKNDKVEVFEDCSVTISMSNDSCTKINFSNSAQISMDWEVNDTPVKTASSFEFDAAEAGNYEICGYYKTSTCPTRTQVCETVVVGKDCFTVIDCSVELVLDQNSCSSTTLSNNLDIPMDWKVNGTEVTGDKVYEFTTGTAGTYEICGSYVTPECPDGAQTCTTLEVGEACFFEPVCEVALTQNENSCSSYSIGNSQQVMMDWKVNGAAVSTGVGFNFDAAAAGTYEICGTYVTTECPDGAQTCTTVEIAQVCLTPEMCEAQLIKTENTCSNYIFTCDYQAAMDWTVNDVPMMSGNVFNFVAETAGTYEICGLNESTECPDGVRACTTVEIGPSCFGNPACEFDIIMDQNSCSTYTISNSLEEDMKWTMNGFQVASGPGFNFEVMMPGSYDICGEFESADCSEGSQECITIEVDEGCF